MPVTDQCRSSQVAALSPVQWAAQPPEPTNVLRVSTNGRRLPADTKQAVASLSHSCVGRIKRARQKQASSSGDCWCSESRQPSRRETVPDKHDGVNGCCGAMLPAETGTAVKAGVSAAVDGVQGTIVFAVHFRQRASHCEITVLHEWCCMRTGTTADTHI